MSNPLENRRPAKEQRNFTSPSVDSLIDRFKQDVRDPELAALFENCFPNTLDTTVYFSTHEGRPDTFVITGDIDAMWLRDSTAQVWPYLPLASKDPRLKDLLAGVVNRQTRCILIDTYANAFNRGPASSQWISDVTEMTPWLHERKWEIDSLCYAVRLAYGYWKATDDTSVFDPNWRQAMQNVVKTLRDQQRKTNLGPYKFQRAALESTDSLPIRGYGYPTAPVGLICSSFRPSDDATIFPFLIPANLFAVVSLRQMGEIMEEVIGDKAFAAECARFADEVEQAIQAYAIHEHPEFAHIYAYEVDGYGGRVFMDDSNVPSLLSLPYLNCLPIDDPIYKATRAFVLSDRNPWFFKGTAAEGVGSPHTGLNQIWPIGITMRALTSTDDQEIVHCLQMLKATTADTGFMHEGFCKDDPFTFSRTWFAWANTIFGELLLKLYTEKPGLLNK